MIGASHAVSMTAGSGEWRRDQSAMRRTCCQTANIAASLGHWLPDSATEAGPDRFDAQRILRPTWSLSERQGSACRLVTRCS